MANAIEIHNLGKEYRRREVGSRRYRTLRDSLTSWGKRPSLNKGDDYFWALRHLDVEIAQGEIVGVIGPNGAGKSTLLKLLSRVTAPTEGSFKLRGRVASLLEVGTGFHPELTGRENIFLSGIIMGMRRAEIKRKFDEIVDFAGVEKFLDLPVKRYSSGMYVRLGFAVAAHLEAEILLVDEVLAVGDAEFQKKSLGKISDVAQDGRTVLFVSHNLGAVSRLCGKSLLLNKNSKTGFGRTENVIQQYSDLAAKRGGITESEGIFVRNSDLSDSLHRIVTVGVKNSLNELTRKMAYGESFSIVIEIQSSRDGKVYGIVGMNDLLGDRIVTLSSIEDEDVFNLKKGKNVLEVKLPPVHWKPGMYGVYVSIAESFSVRYDSYASSPFIEMSELGYDSSENYGGYWGKIVMRGNWTLNTKQWNVEK